jgi:hypothetical protein
MRLNRAAATIVVVAILSGCGVAAHGAAAVAPPAKNMTSSHPATSQLVAAIRSTATDPSLVWLESAGGQAQMTFNDDVDSLAWALEIEDHSPTVANHLVFEADARVVRAEAWKILRTPALLPKVNRARYERMLKDFIVVANLLQPGPGYGTTAQDDTAWYAAQSASNITVS